MRRLSWILWLLIALMPVRGITQSLMSFAPAQSEAVVAAALPVDGAPCPMHAASADATDTAAPAASGSSPTSHSCSLCNVCHSAAMPLTLGVTPASALPEDEPVPAHGLGAGRAAPAKLFRPPR
jgi:cytochrome c553